MKLNKSIERVVLLAVGSLFTAACLFAQEKPWPVTSNDPDELDQIIDQVYMRCRARIDSLITAYAKIDTLYFIRAYGKDPDGNLFPTLYFYDDDGSNYVSFKSPALSANTDYQWPTADGTANQNLETDGSAALSWADDDTGAMYVHPDAITLEHLTSDTIDVINFLRTDTIRSRSANFVFMEVDFKGLWLQDQTGGRSARLNFMEDKDSPGENFISFQAPASLAGNTNYALPSTDGSSGQLLGTDGSANMSWVGYSPVDTLQTDTLRTDVVAGRGAFLYANASAGLWVTDKSDGSTPKLYLSEKIGNGSNYVSLRSVSSLAANVELVLPSDDGSVGQLMKTDGSGVLGWYSVSPLDTLTVVNLVADTIAGLTKTVIMSTGITTDTIKYGGSGLVLDGFTVQLKDLDGSTTPQLAFYEDADSGTTFISFRAPHGLATPQTYVWPYVDGSSGDVLSTDGSGVLSWITP